jgi:hypothetical protein
MGALALGALGLTAAGCEETNTPDPPAPTPPVVTERFSGLLPPNGALTFTFDAAAAGAVTATLSSLGQNDTTVSLSLGTFSGTPGAASCQIVIANDNIGANGQVNGQTSTAGRLCARLSDVGRLTGATTFELTIVHP